MSAESTLVLWGVRYELSDTELEPCERRADERQLRARAAGLDHYFGNFGGEGKKYLLFVGKKLAVIGAEGTSELALAHEQLSATIRDANTRLSEQGFHDLAALHVVWQPDA